MRRNEEENIFPFVSRCDLFIDTTLEYELNILAPYLRRILSSMNEGGEYYAEGAEILDAIKDIEGIDSSVIGKNSLYKEFV